MKKTDKIAYQQKSQEELGKLLLEKKKALVEFRTKHAAGSIKDTSVYAKLRREIAVILTLIKEKENEIKQ